MIKYNVFNEKSYKYIKISRNPVFIILITFFLLLSLTLIHIDKIIYAITNLGYEIHSFQDVLYIVFSFTGDIFFCFITFLILLIILKKYSSKIKFIFISIITIIIFILLIVYSIADLIYFKTSGVSISWQNVVHLDNLSNLFDSGLYYLNPYIIFILLLSLFCFVYLTYYLTGKVLKNVLIISIKETEIPKKYFRILFIIIIFIFSNYYLLSIKSKVELNSIPVIKLLTTFLKENNSKKTDSSTKLSSNNISNSILSSLHTPISITDRKIQMSIKEKLKKLKSRKFNVIFYLTESTYAGYYPMYGNKQDVSPFLSKASSKSLFFRNMYSTGVRSINSIFSLLTGINGYPGYKSITFVNPEMETPAMSQILKKEGYSTALLHGGSFDFYNKLLFLNNRDFDLLGDEKYFKSKYPDIFSFSWGIDDRVMVEDGLSWIDTQTKNKKNFFLTYVPILPHHPYTLPPNTDFLIKDPKSLYDSYLNSLYYVDGVFKQLYTGLEKRNLLDNTIIVFLADHGEAFGQHKGNLGHENFIYEENVKVPGIIFNKELFNDYNEFEGIVTNSDIFTTTLDLLGIEKPEFTQGESVLKMNSGKIAFFASNENTMDIGLRDGDFKAIYNMNSNSFRLFNIKNDSKETIDISSQEPGLSKEYQNLLMDYFKYEKDYIENFSLNMNKNKTNDKTLETSLLNIKPFFAVQQFYSIEKNLTADKENPLTINGITYDKGFGVFSNSIMKFDIKGMGYKNLKGLAGKIDSPSTKENYLEMQIIVDGRLAFTTGKLSVGDDAISFDIDINNAETIELIELDAGDNQSEDSAAWLNPVLEK